MVDRIQHFRKTGQDQSGTTKIGLSEQHSGATIRFRARLCSMEGVHKVSIFPLEESEGNDEVS
jgi:hypothetical protein